MSIGSYQSSIEAALNEMGEQRIIERIWAHDYTVWKPEPEEISNRLGWLDIIEPMQAQIPRMQALVDAVREDGCTHALLLGMGGSSLAPEVFRKTFGVRDGYLDLAVLDSTDPGAVLSAAERLDPSKTVFIVSTKSGGTVETLSFFKYFYNVVLEAVGPNSAGEHFIAITDPGSKLEDIARQYNFRDVLLNDPNIGGRYSALSYFGLLPAALVGVDLEKLLDRAAQAADSFKTSSTESVNNQAEYLGAVMGELAKAGRDKLTLVLSQEIASLGDWIEQLVAESTGKEGAGILPVVGEIIGKPDRYGEDRLFVYLKLDGDGTYEIVLRDLESAGHPVVTLGLDDAYDLGAQIFLWELATAVAGSRLGINPFDQPNVEAAKILARQLVADYQEGGELPETKPSQQSDGISVYGDILADSPGGMLETFLAGAQPGAYVALQAYVKPTPETGAALSDLRTRIRDHTRLATTLGYGPRFLHSTGQLHKGDAGRGLFIQFTADDPQDVDIPDQAGSDDSSITFGLLKSAQVLGDAQALHDADRQVIRFHLGGDANAALAYLARAIE